MLEEALSSELSKCSLIAVQKAATVDFDAYVVLRNELSYLTKKQIQFPVPQAVKSLENNVYETGVDYRHCVNM